MKKPKILIVEDEIIIASDLKMRLEQHGYEVLSIASTADSAVSMALQHHPDLILMDVMLKGPLTGIDAACQIYDSIEIPIIFLTGNQQFIDEGQIKQMNYSILSKPPIEFELIEEINRGVESRFPRD